MGHGGCTGFQRHMTGVCSHRVWPEWVCAAFVECTSDHNFKVWICGTSVLLASINFE